MIRCPICHRALSPFGNHPHAPICSDACRREALSLDSLRSLGIPSGVEGRRAGVMEDGPQSPASQPAQFEQFNATHLYCSTCHQSMPTRERLLLTLPSGDLYGYVCARCGTDVGTKTATHDSSK